MVEKRVKQTGPLQEITYHFQKVELEQLLRVPGAFKQVGGVLLVNENNLDQAMVNAGMTIQVITEESPTEESIASPGPARRKLPRPRTS